MSRPPRRDIYIMDHLKNMHSKISLKKSFLPFSIVGVIFSLIIIFLSPTLVAQSAYNKTSILSNNQISQNQINSKQTTSTQNIFLSKQANPELPTRLKIPKIKVNAIFEYVGLTPAGAMGAPKNQKNVAWFEIGPRPGEIGSSVISGHYGWKGGKPSVFDNLHKLRPGDNIYIEDEKGVIITFVVRESKRYKPNDDASDVFVSSDGKAHLNLITCEGVWDKIAKQYSKRLVVFTDKEEIKK